MLYVGQWRWAVFYLGAVLAVVATGLFTDLSDAAWIAMPWLLALAGAVHAYRLAARYPPGRLRRGYSRWYGLLGVTVAWVVLLAGLRIFLMEPFRVPSISMFPTLRTGSRILVQKWGYGHYGAYGLSLVRRPMSSALARGDLIVFDFPPNRSVQYVKRLIGLPGDKVAYLNGRLSINGQQVPSHVQGESPAGESVTAAGSGQIVREVLAGRPYETLLDKDHPAPLFAAMAYPFRDACVYIAQSGVTCQVPAGHYFVLGDNRDNSYDSRMWGFVPADHILGKVIHGHAGAVFP